MKDTCRSTAITSVWVRWFVCKMILHDGKVSDFVHSVFQLGWQQPNKRPTVLWPGWFPTQRQPMGGQETYTWTMEDHPQYRQIVSRLDIPPNKMLCVYCKRDIISSMFDIQTSQSEPAITDSYKDKCWVIANTFFFQQQHCHTPFPPVGPIYGMICIKHISILTSVCWLQVYRSIEETVTLTCVSDWELILTEFHTCLFLTIMCLIQVAVC